jgi:hypothetical protein
MSLEGLLSASDIKVEIAAVHSDVVDLEDCYVASGAGDPAIGVSLSMSQDCSTSRLERLDELPGSRLLWVETIIDVVFPTSFRPEAARQDWQALSVTELSEV